ncbi:MAG TPA: SRPBCC family protein [Steroidobacteraceae bacterium]|nr:SRPBCC family protein [Steroidobacteraceae bacterium]
MTVRIQGRLLFQAAMTLSWLTMPAHAAQVLGVRVTRHDGRFLIGMRITIDAPAPAVFRALQDYSAMTRYNPDLRAVRVQSTRVPDRVRLFTTVHTCVLVFCKTMHQEQIMTAIPGADGGVLQAQLLPRGGAFKAGSGRWSVRPCPATPTMTCLHARIDLVPAFWVPPVVGPWVIRDKMKAEARRTSAGLEAMARRSHTPAGSRQPAAGRSRGTDPVSGIRVPSGLDRSREKASGMFRIALLRTVVWNTNVQAALGPLGPDSSEEPMHDREPSNLR